MSFYDVAAGGYEELYGEEQRKKLALIGSLIAPGKSDVLLDVGSGPGYAVEFFDCKVVALDPSVGLLKMNRAALRVVGRAEELPFVDGSFDVVLCLSVIHHCDVERALGEMRRVGRGDFVVSVLRKSKRRGSIEKMVGETFKIVRVLEDVKDVIFVGKKG